MSRARERALIGQRDQLSGYGPLVLHPGSGSEAKNHPPEFWLELIRALRGTMPGRHVKLLLGPAEEWRFELFSGNLRDTGVAVHMHPKSDRLVRILEVACAYVGQDSGVTHLAALLGTPTMALFRSSSIHRWHPLGPCVKVVQADTASPVLVGGVLEWMASMTGHAMADRPPKGPTKESKKS
jgi:ADP-heptose:LPS heptosyltransferase